MDILALLMQCSVFFFMTRYQTRFFSYMDSVLEFTQIAASLILISVRYWENFIDRDICSFHIQSFKASLRLGRCKTYVFASLWKIGLTLACAYILVPNMTPMAELFNHIGNETAYDNTSVSTDYNFDNEYYYPPINETGGATIVDSPYNYNDVKGGVYNYGNYGNVDYNQNYPGYVYNDDGEKPPPGDGNNLVKEEKEVPKSTSGLRFKRQAEEENSTSNSNDVGAIPPVENVKMVNTEVKESENVRQYDGNYNEIDYEIYQQYLDYASNNNNKNYILEDESKAKDTELGNTEPDTASDDKNTDTADEYSPGTDIGSETDSTDDENPADDNNVKETEDKTKIKIRKKIRKKKVKPTETSPPEEQPPLSYNDYNYDDYSFSTGDEEVDKVLFRFLPLIVQAISGAICYYFARVACKLCMQGFSFSLPLAIITPSTAAIFCYFCFLQDWTRVGLPNLEIGYWKCSESYLKESFHWQVCEILYLS